MIGISTGISPSYDQNRGTKPQARNGAGPGNAKFLHTGGEAVHIALINMELLADRKGAAGYAGKPEDDLRMVTNLRNVYVLNARFGQVVVAAPTTLAALTVRLLQREDRLVVSRRPR
jgi:hypothetical protein